MKIPPRTRDQIIALAKKNLPPRAIAQAISPSVGTYQIYDCLREARRADPTIPRFGGVSAREGADPNARSIAVPHEVLRELKPHAGRRNLSPGDLVKALLTAIANDDLVDAILDDGAVW